MAQLMLLFQDLRCDSAAAESLAQEAAGRLARACTWLMGTYSLASAALLERAAALLPANTELHVVTSVDWAQALIRGHQVDAAIELLDRIAVPAGDRLPWRITLLRLRAALYRDDPSSLDECLLVAVRAEEALTRAGDDAGLAAVH